MSNRVSRQLAEIALRVTDIAVMRDFYRDAIGLDLIREAETFVFFKVADGLAGHTQVLALFDRSSQDGYVAPEGKRTTVDHLAFSICKTDFDSEDQRLQSLGCDLSYAYHDWVKWRSLYVVDPEGNLVEFVCYDPDSK